MSTIASLMPGLDSILGIRDAIGAGLKEVWLVTRSWSGVEPGDGTALEVRARMLPTPQIVDYSHRHNLTPGGAVQQGDLILKMISKASYPSLATVGCVSDDRKVEKFYEVGGTLYEVISVTESHLTWNVQIRKLSDQTRYS